jgi:hypothetical protein
MLRIALTVPSVSPAEINVDFLVDTGASSTCVHPLDARRKLLIPMEKLTQPPAWDRHERRRRVGGLVLYFEVPARYSFLHDDGRAQER